MEGSKSAGDPNPRLGSSKSASVFGWGIQIRGDPNPRLHMHRTRGESMHRVTIMLSGQTLHLSIHIAAPSSQVFALLLLKPGHSIQGWTPLALSVVRKAYSMASENDSVTFIVLPLYFVNPFFLTCIWWIYGEKNLQEQEVFLTWHMPSFAAEERWAPQSINWSLNYWAKIVCIPPRSRSSHAPRWMIVFSSAYSNTFVHIDFCYLQWFSGLVDRSTDKKWTRTKHLQPWQIWQIWKDTFRENWEITVFQISI